MCDTTLNSTQVSFSMAYSIDSDYIGQRIEEASQSSELVLHSNDGINRLAKDFLGLLHSSFVVLKVAHGFGQLDNGGLR